ncbi:FixH family protein [Chloroflexus sp.]|uniref:FixH family protein n=1 Tax=Chloroflexus sp. TaxID=1904827 RepID=UPI00298EDA30|nr:FixH family protein [Chloroflexus sp.]MDW8403292.1 FixH family protein [Chloroflexus sp.]
MFPFVRWLGFIVLLAAITACSSAVELRETQVVDGLSITLDTPNRPRMNTAVDFIVLLNDAQGNPVNDANVYLDLDMPAMPMGVTRPVALPDGPGRYWARTAYTMEGLWEITVVVERATTTYRATFRRDVLK